jgi:hypothetical protein
MPPHPRAGDDCLSHQQGAVRCGNAVGWRAWAIELFNVGSSLLISRRTGKRTDAPCCDVLGLVEGKIKRLDCRPKGSIVLPQLRVIGNLRAEAADASRERSVTSRWRHNRTSNAGRTRQTGPLPVRRRSATPGGSLSTIHAKACSSHASSTRPGLLVAGQGPHVLHEHPPFPAALEVCPDESHQVLPRVRPGPAPPRSADRMWCWRTDSPESEGKSMTTTNPPAAQAGSDRVGD